jgi:protein-L-isoaspartate(D-aspartate) O-methyltransferase
MTADEQRAALLLALRQQGIRNSRVLEAIEKVPRELFVNEVFRSRAWDDTALPIACGQTISQPYVVAFMTDRLDIDKRHKVLEIGTGSGYQAAVLAQLCRRVYTIERYRTLASEACARFKKLKIGNITQMVGDGSKGWPAQAPFERIIVTAAAKEPPPALLEQLAVGGMMVIPLEETPARQNLVKITRTETGYDRDLLLPVRFVPLIEGAAKEA